MKRNRQHQTASPEETKTAADELLETMFKLAKAQFGDAIKSFWFYDSDFCPGCSVRPIDMMKVKGKEMLAVNWFIHRPRGTLIGYFLCGECATYIHVEAKKNPYKETPMHAEIERNLIAGYHKHLNSLDA